MSRFTTYAIKEISSSFLFLLILFSGILWMGQGLRHIDLLTAENISFVSYFSYIILLLPKILLLTVPICIFLAILFNLNRLRNDSELVILWSSGKSEREVFIVPIILFSLLTYLFLIISSVFITPYSLNEIRQKIIEIRSSGIHLALLKEKKFISPTNTLTIFLQERENQNISGLLIHDQKMENKPQTYIAQKGKFIIDGSKKILRLYNGNIQILDKKQGKISEIAFETYDLNLTPYNKEENTHVYSDELLTNDIIKNLSKKKISNFSKYEKEQYAELHTRFINPIYIFCYALLPLLVIKFASRPMDNWLFPTIVISTIAFFIQISQITLSNLLIENSKIVIFNYLMPILIIISIYLILYLEDFKILKK